MLQELNSYLYQLTSGKIDNSLPVISPSVTVSKNLSMTLSEDLLCDTSTTFDIISQMSGVAHIRGAKSIIC